MDRDIPFVSVMILCYNYGHLLKKALDACAAQTFRDFEIVMINNGSTDNTEEVYRQFCRENPEIRTSYVPVYPNQGPCHGWNEGLSHARGEFVLFNDADDWMEPDCLKLLAEKAKETGADRVTGRFQDVLPDNSIGRKRKFMEAGGGITIQTPMLQGVIFKRIIILENKLLFPEHFFLSHDTWFVYNFAIAEKNECHIVDKVIYNYYYNPNAVSRSILLDVDKRVKNAIFPLIDITKEAIEKTDNLKLKNEMEYLTLRVIYSSYLSAYSGDDKKNADNYYDKVREKLKRELPNYLKNPLLWKINNGYDIAGNLACNMIGCLDLINAKSLINIIGKMVKKDAHIIKCFL